MERKEYGALTPDEKNESMIYIVGLASTADGPRDTAAARAKIAADFVRMDGLVQMVILLHFYDDTPEEMIARMLHSSLAAVRRLLLFAHASFEKALSEAGLDVSYRDMPQLIFEALDELIWDSTVPPESVARVRRILMENS